MECKKQQSLQVSGLLEEKAESRSGTGNVWDKPVASYHSTQHASYVLESRYKDSGASAHRFFVAKNAAI